VKKILIACEYSGIVREAFKKQGLNAWSCDILPSDIPGQHIQGNVLEYLINDWDAMIGFPPCTFLTYAGMAFWEQPQRVLKRIAAANFFMKLFTAPIRFKALEQPQGIMNKIFRQPDQIIHPYYFNEPQMKRTGLYLHNLPPLKYNLIPTLFGPASACAPPKPIQTHIRKKTGQIKYRHFTDAIENNHFKTGHQKSKTFPAIANAMAEQWAPIILNS
jgi:hypothetical protein